MAQAQHAQFVAQSFAKLRTICKQRNENDSAGFEAGFGGVRAVGLGQAAEAAVLEHNKVKNRYLNILPYDRTRVVLKMPDGRDYINASWCTGASRPKQYIATQGPVPASFEEFWWMVWTVKTPVIVMTTREVEKNVLKCHRYWPESDVKKVGFGILQVEHLSTASHTYHIERRFRVTCDGQEGSLEVTQLCYQSWPDHGVPLTTEEFLEFRAAANFAWQRDFEKPMIVHCSAGVGRTGTYIACDRALTMLQQSQDTNLDKIMQDLRMCRNYMVQTLPQYVFVHKVILNALRNLLVKHQATLQRQVTEAAIQAEEERRQLEEEEAQEQEEVAQMMQGQQANARVTVMEDDDVKSAEAQWQPQGDYDVQFSMTTVESRFEALHSLGVNIEKAAVEQVVQLVKQAKASREAQRTAQAQATMAEEQAKAEEERRRAASAKEAAKQAAKAEVTSKAQRYMRKMSLQ